MAGILKLIAGVAEIAGGIALDVVSEGSLAPIGNMLIGMGIGMTLSGVGSLVAGDPVKGFATASRNPISPWVIAYGRVRPRCAVVYDHTWGNNDIVRDLVFVIASNSCLSVDELLFDQQRIQIDTNAIPTSRAAGYTIPAPATGSGTTFTPVQQKIFITTISRSNDVVTVVLPQDIPYLTAGDQIQVLDNNGGQLLQSHGFTGTFQVAEIVSRVPSGGTNILTFTYLCGGLETGPIQNNGEVHTLWADYGRTVYFEPLYNPLLGQTFIGMTAGVPWQGTGKLNTPAAQPNAQGSISAGTAGPNPWTNFCSLQGKTSVFLRIQYDSKYYKAGLPQISFHIRGKNDIYDPRLGNCTGIKQVGLTNAGAGYVPLSASLYSTGDILWLDQDGASRGQVTVTAVDSNGAITGFVVSNPGSGYKVGTATAVGGRGSGAIFQIQVLTGDEGCNVYTENAALCIADFLADQTWGYKAQYGTDIPIQPLIDAANICDETVTLANGGSEPRYALSGQFDLTMRRGEILQNMLTACAGRITPEAPFIIQPGYWAGPGTPPLQVDLQAISAGPYHWKGPTIHEQYNGVKGTYISPENKWQSTDYPPYAQDGDHGYSGPLQYGGDINLAADNGERRWFELNLPFTISAATAQRIAKIELLRRRWANSGSGTFALNMAGYQFAPLDVFEGTASFVGLKNQLLEVKSTRLVASDSDGALKLGVEVDVQQTDSSIYQWSSEEELSAQGYVQSKFPRGHVAESVCWPWSPGYVAPLTGDAVYPQGPTGPASFGIQPIYGSTTDGAATAALAIRGVPPINAVDTGIANPQISCVGSASGGSLPAGTYVVGLSAYDSGSATHANSDYLNLSTVFVDGIVDGTGTGSIAVTVSWGSGDDGGDLYIAQWTANGYVFHYNQTLAPGSTSATITTFHQSQPGGPDPLFHHFGVNIWQIIHSGRWAQQVQAVTPNTITIAGDGMTANMWAGSVLSLLAKWDNTVEVPILNMPVQSNTASSGTPAEFTVTIGPNSAGQQLPDLTTLLAVGDLLVMRDNPTFTGTSFSDPLIANPYYTSGATGVEAGHVAMVLSGADAGDVQTISSVSQDANGNSTIFNLAGSWTVTPKTGDIVVICAPSNLPEFPSSSFSVKNSSSFKGTVVQPNVLNLEGQTWLFQVRTEDVNGNYGPDALAPVRELYFFGANGTRTVIQSGEMLITDGLVSCDATNGPIVYTCLPFVDIPNRTFTIVKVDSSPNTVTVQIDTMNNPTDMFDDGTTSVVLTKQGDSIQFRVHG